MKMSLIAMIVICAGVATASCSGGGDDEVRDPRTGEELTFIDWIGNPAGEIVKDVNLDEFKFTSPRPNAASCLYSPQAVTVILNLCHAVGQVDHRYLFGNRFVDVMLVRHVDGRCSAGMVDAESGQVIELVSRNGMLEVAPSGIAATLC